MIAKLSKLVLIVKVFEIKCLLLVS